MEKRAGWVYGLFDVEEPQRIRYVGKTISRRGVSDRLYHHLWAANNLNRQEPSARWIRKIGASQVGCRVLEETIVDRIDDAEIRWISDLRSRGLADLNIQPGGTGASPEQVSGENNPKAKLTWDLVNSIRAAASIKYTRTSEVARAHGLTPAAVSKVILNMTWHDPLYDPSDRVTIGEGNRTGVSADLVWRTLTDPQVEELRRLYLSGTSIVDLCSQTGQPSTSIHRALFTKYGSEESRLRCVDKRGPVRKLQRGTPEDVKTSIVNRYLLGESQGALSRELGVSQTTISLWVRHDRLK